MVKMKLCLITAIALATPAIAQQQWPLGSSDVASASAKSFTSVQPSDLAAAASNNLAIMAATTPQFVGGSSAYQTLAQLLSKYPCATPYLGMLAHTSDTFGSVSTTLVCENDVNGFYWRPQRTDYSIAIPIASGSLTLTPLLSAPTVYLPTTPTGTVNVILSTTNAWPGATFHIYAPATISLSNVNISGLVGGGTVPLVQGSDKIVTYVSGTGWKSN